MNVLRETAAGSQSPSTAQAWTTLPPFCVTGVEGEEWAGRLDADLLAELPDGGGQRVLARLDLALGDRPGPLVLVSEKRAAGVDEEDLQAVAGPAIHQQPGAHSGLRQLSNPLSGSGKAATRIDHFTRNVWIGTMIIGMPPGEVPPIIPAAPVPGMIQQDSCLVIPTCG